MPAVRPRLCVWVGREMWVTQRTVTAGYYTIGDGWHAGGSGHERCVLVGNPHASSASRILLNGRLGARGFTGHGSSQAEVANGHIGPGVLSCQLARRRLFTHTFTRWPSDSNTGRTTHCFVLSLNTPPPTLTHSLTLPTHTHTHAAGVVVSERDIFTVSLSVECVGALLSFRCFTFTQVVN